MLSSGKFSINGTYKSLEIEIRNIIKPTNLQDFWGSKAVNFPGFSFYPPRIGTWDFLKRVLARDDGNRILYDLGCLFKNHTQRIFQTQRHPDFWLEMKATNINQKSTNTEKNKNKHPNKNPWFFRIWSCI